MAAPTQSVVKAEDQRAVGTQHAPQLAQSRAEVGPEAEGVDAEGLVEGLAVVGNVGSVALVDADAARRQLAEQVTARNLEHHRGGIDACGQARGVAAGDAPERSAVAAAELEDRLAGLRLEAGEQPAVHARRVERHHACDDVTELAVREGGLTGDELGLGHAGPPVAMNGLFTDRMSQSSF